MTNTLYCFGESGNAYKAALCLTLAGVPWQPHFVDFFNGEARGAEFRAINPMGEVPVLDAGGKILTQSGLIQTWVMDETGKLAGASATDRQEILRWILFDNQKVSGTAGPLRFLMNFAPEDKRDAGVIGYLTGRMQAALSILEGVLSTRDWIACDSVSAADIACAGYLYYPENFNFTRADYPAISAWLTRLARQPNWAHPYDLMPAPTLGKDDGFRDA